MKHAHSKKGHLNYTINNYIYDFMYTTGGIYTSVLMPSSTGTWNAPPAHDGVELTRIELVHKSSALVSFPFLATQSQSLQQWPDTSWTVITAYYLSHCDYCLLCILQAFMKMTKIPSVYLGKVPGSQWHNHHSNLETWNLKWTDCFARLLNSRTLYSRGEGLVTFSWAPCRLHKSL